MDAWNVGRVDRRTRRQEDQWTDVRKRKTGKQDDSLAGGRVDKRAGKMDRAKVG